MERYHFGALKDIVHLKHNYFIKINKGLYIKGKYAD